MKKPAPPTSVTAQIRARRLADNPVEFTLRLKGDTEVTTANRYMKLTEIVAGRWYASGAFTTTIEGVEYTLGAVSARLDNTVCPAQVWVTFIPTGSERITPTKYKLSVDRMDEAPAGTSIGPGREGGYMLSDEPDTARLAQDSNTQETCAESLKWFADQ